MQTPSSFSKYSLTIIVTGFLLLTANSTNAESDKQKQDRVLRTREMLQHQGDHSMHTEAQKKSKEFHGVFYGYLPCDDCDGVKMTLSLKNDNNYLLVSQPARQSSREYFDKGKYEWNEEDLTVVLTSKKDSTVRQYRIKDEGTLIQLQADGSAMPGDEDSYALRRSDKTKSREMHIH